MEEWVTSLLEQDSHEWNDILNQFDPDEIERDVRDSLAQCKLIRLAMKQNDTDWEYRTRRD